MIITNITLHLIEGLIVVVIALSVIATIYGYSQELKEDININFKDARRNRNG